MSDRNQARRQQGFAPYRSGWQRQQREDTVRQQGKVLFGPSARLQRGHMDWRQNKKQKHTGQRNEAP